MDFKSSFDLRHHLLDEVSLSSQTKSRREPTGSSAHVNSGSLQCDSVDSEQDDPTALVRELPAVDKINALNASLKNEEAVQNHVEARNLSLEEAARYIMENGSTGQKKSLFQRFRETLAALDMGSISHILMIAVDSMWAQDPELQCFAPDALLDVLPLLNSTVSRELFMATTTMLSVKTVQIRIAWNRLFLAFVDCLNAKQLENDMVPLALRKTEHVEPQDQRELSCDLIGGVCNHLSRDVVEKKLMNKVLSLCQDTNVGVRRHICQQLGIVARALGVDRAKEKVAKDLFELLNDEDQTVSRAAFSCLVDLVKFFGPCYRREHLYPIIKTFILHPPEEAVSLIVGELGRFLWEIKADIQTNEDVLLFANFYVNAVQKGDDEARRMCAYNLPSVVASLPIAVYSSHTLSCCDSLATDPNDAVRRSIAAGLHELVALLGDKAALYLRKPFLELFADSKKYVFSALAPNISVLIDCFVRQLKPPDKRSFFNSVEEALLQLCVRADSDWRIMEYVLNILSLYYREMQETTLHDKFIPILLRCERSGAYCIKRFCASVCVKIVSNMLNVNNKVLFFSKLNNDYAHSNQCLVRQSYLRFLGAVCDHFSRRFVRERMIDSCFELQRDSMELVRLELARVLPALIKVLEGAPGGSLLEEYQGMVHRLQMDESCEVRGATRDAVEAMERRERELKRDAGKAKMEEENREDRRREQAEGQLLDVAKEFDKAERRSKLRDLLKSEREKEQAETLRKGGGVASGGGRRATRGVSSVALPSSSAARQKARSPTHSIPRSKRSL